MKENPLHAGIERLIDEATDGSPEEDERWRALSFGELGDEEERALRREAAESDEAARRWQAYRPMGSTARQRLLKSVRRELGQPPAAGSGSAGSARDVAASESASPEQGPDAEDPALDRQRRADADGRESGPLATPEKGSATVVPFPGSTSPISTPPASTSPTSTSLTSTPPVSPLPVPSTSLRRPWWALPSVAALAAAVLAVVLWPRPPVALPDYELSAEAGSQRLRAPSQAVEGELTLRRGSSFELYLVPAVAVDGPLATAAYARRAHGLESVELDVEISATGSVRLEGRLDDELLAGGESVELWVTVASRGALPDASQLLANADPPEEAPWRLLRCRVRAEASRDDGSGEDPQGP